MMKPTIYHSLDLFDGATTIGAVQMSNALTFDTALNTGQDDGLILHPRHFWPDVALLWRQIEHLALFLDHLEFHIEALLQERALYLADRPSPSARDLRLQGVELILKERQFRQSFYRPRRQAY